MMRGKIWKAWIDGARGGAEFPPGDFADFFVALPIGLNRDTCRNAEDGTASLPDLCTNFVLGPPAARAADVRQSNRHVDGDRARAAWIRKHAGEIAKHTDFGVAAFPFGIGNGDPTAFATIDSS
jgi:hypothetical protein